MKEPSSAAQPTRDARSAGAVTALPTLPSARRGACWFHSTCRPRCRGAVSGTGVRARLTGRRWARRWRSSSWRRLRHVPTRCSSAVERDLSHHRAVEPMGCRQRASTASTRAARHVARAFRRLRTKCCAVPCGSPRKRTALRSGPRRAGRPVGFGPRRASDPASLRTIHAALLLPAGARFVRLSLGRQGLSCSPAACSSIFVGRQGLCGRSRVAQVLRQSGVGDSLVEIGGELAGYGVKPDGTPWWVALIDVAAGGDGERHARPWSLFTACRRHVRRRGRYFVDGRRCSHTIDPRTGRPVPDQLASVTVLHHSCMHADALATALTVLGPDAGFDYAQARGLAARFVVRSLRQIDERMTTAFAAMLQ